MTVVVTGAAGFVGSNIVRALNLRGITDIIAVDNLTNGAKFCNLAECSIAHYLDKHKFIRQVNNHCLPYSDIKAVFHNGACSDTAEQNGKYIMDNNYQYSLDLLDWCQDERIPYIYASDAAVYGKNETCDLEKPHNIYAYTKYQFDSVVKYRMMSKRSAQIVGLRYFHVYGRNEQHKNHTASAVFHYFNQYREHGYINLHHHGKESGDFVSVEDVVKVNLFFFDSTQKSGIYNLGTGCRRQFDELAAAVINACRTAENKAVMALEELTEEELIRYNPLSDAPINQYNSFAHADISALQNAGYGSDFYNIEEGVERYVQWLLENF